MATGSANKIEQLVFGDERGGTIEEIEQQVEQLRRQADDLAAAQHVISGAIDEERTEPIRRRRHGVGLYSTVHGGLFARRRPA